MPHKDNTKRLEYQKNWQAQRRKKRPSYNMFHLAKQRAKHKGIPFDICLEDISIPAVCPIFGTPLRFGSSRNNTPSLDRVDPRKGYTKENIRVISNKANQLKSNSTLEDLRKIINYMESHNESCD